MNEAIFNQLDFARGGTIKTVENVTEQEANIIPEGFTNNIRWNLGHIYTVHEQFAFATAGEPVQMPEGFEVWFATGTKPADWTTEPPALSELVALLQEQTARIRETFSNRLDQSPAHPLTIGPLTFQTVGELLAFSMYHEGMHTQTIKSYKKMIR
ncbi:putative damage-inducible protein DinB [Paenibacillus sp. LBL]|uniref:DinB family protein n=1 Tax=Paenibacillus sp. LBL TaxID=2940563 RepID=UPI002473BA22|nr:DinB family protein [Paenibacillus sp. LBL]MDH6672646.1 putative damage-inducible protein DinB [Paenibacillus sp. LBL]